MTEATPCDASTRFINPLGDVVSHGCRRKSNPGGQLNPTMRTRMLLFKRHAPNDMKKEDLIAKWWIIADRGTLSPDSPPDVKLTALTSRRLRAHDEMRELLLILYSQKTYGI